MGFHWSLGIVSLFRPWATEQGTAGPKQHVLLQGSGFILPVSRKSTARWFWFLKMLMSLDGVLASKEYGMLNAEQLNKLWKSGKKKMGWYLCCRITASLVYIFSTNSDLQVKIGHWKAVFRKFYYKIVQVLSNWFSITCVTPGAMLFLPPVPQGGK